MASGRSPKDFFRPLAVGAPEPLREVPWRPSRMIHFFDPSNPKMVAKVPDIASKVDVLLGNLEDAVQAGNKEAARAGLVEVGRTAELGAAQLWTRINSLDSPWALDDLVTLVTEIGDRLDVVMVPKVEGPEDIHYVDRLLAQLEARAGISRPLQVHAILETAAGVARVEEIAQASPRMQGISLGPADLAADRRMKTTRVGGGHPGYLVREDPHADGGPRAMFQQDLWHYTVARMVDACAQAGIYPYYGPFGDIKDVVACEDQFRNAYLLGCVGTWSLHPVQIDIAKKVFSPDPAEVAWARRVVEEMGDGTGAVMIDGKMQDDASVKQCKVVLRLAQDLAARDPELAGVRAVSGSGRARRRSEHAPVLAEQLCPVLRSVLYMPSSNARALEKAKTLPADAIIFDLEDAVAPDAKELARDQACAAVAAREHGEKVLTIRCNGLDTPWGEDDLRAAGQARPTRWWCPR